VPPPLPAAPGGAAAAGLKIGGAAQDFPDPFVLRVDDATTCGGQAACYYAYATESGLFGLLNVPVARSTDLIAWNWAGPDRTGGPGGTPDGKPDRNAMPALAPWVEFGGNWAPSVLARPSNPAEQRYVMYYTARSKDGSAYGGKECVGIATAATPDGPFVDTSTAPALCQTAAGGTIDASPFVASDGSAYLTYSDDVGIRVQRLTSNGLALAGSEQLLMRFDTGYPWEFPRIEGPTMLSTPATGIVLLYSAGTFDNAKYSVGAARCDTPLGPCHNTYSTPTLASRSAMFGPGGQTPFQLPDGSWRVAFHAWDNVVGYGAGGLRALHVLPLSFPAGNPAIG
jgi:beta-xylosidase